jgi:4-amino-4-deoxy-L-arabinose transferase-like glycosyltransferase
MKKKFKFLLLLGVVLLAAVLRLYKLGGTPSSLNRDEASLGYNAYSILKTGKDEWGENFPLSFKSFGDYKLPGYIYALIPFIKIFGLNDFSVRLPSALAGIGLVIIVFFLTKSLFRKYLPALFSSFALAIVPWHIHYSRTAFEANVALTIQTLGISLLILARKNKKLLPLSAVVMILSLFFYNNPYFVLPFLIIAAFILWKDIFFKKENKRTVFLSILLLFLGGVLALLTVGKVNFAKKGITIFSSWRLHEQIVEKRAVYPPGSILARLFHNKYILIGRDWILGYLKSFETSFLFAESKGHIWNNVAGIGNFYLWDLPFLLLGLRLLLLKFSKSKKFLLVWFLVGCLPSSVTINAPHPTRCHNLFLTLSILSGLGLWYGLNLIKKKNIKTIYLFSAFLIYLFSLARYLDLYYRHFPLNMAEKWYNGIGKTLEKASQIPSDLIVLDDKVEYGYIYVLYYNKINPDKFRSTVVTEQDASGFIHVKSFSGYAFKRLENFKQVPPNTTIINMNSSYTSNTPGVYEFKTSDGILWEILKS